MFLQVTINLRFYDQFKMLGYILKVVAKSFQYMFIMFGH